MKTTDHNALFFRFYSLQRLPVGVLALWVSLTLLLTGCANLAGPEYERPTTATKSSWKASPGADVSAAETIDPDWWKYFGDQELNRLITQAIEQSIDLKVLAARMGVARTAVGQVKAASLPSMQVGAGTSLERSTGRSTVQQYNVATSVNWELDIWGKVKKGVDAQRAEVLATSADWRAGYLNLVAEVSTTYFQLLKLDEQMSTQRNTLNDAQRVLSIVSGLHQEGIVPQTRVLQQQAEINQLNRDLLELQRLRSITENALATLLGTAAGEMKVPAGKLSQNIEIIKVPGGLPSDLLARRPDILAAEYRVLKAHNLEGQAKLAKLPSFSLTSRLGSSSFGLSDLLKSFTAGLLPSVNIPILDPSINARYKVSQAQAKVAREEYRRVVIKAFEEVENSLINLDSRKKQRRELESQLEKLRVVSGQVKQQLREGMVSQLEVFESERSLLAAELGLLENKQQILADTVTLYKALGGGWSKVQVQQASL